MATTAERMSTTRWAAILIPIVMLGTAYWLWSLSGGDPLDRFEVLRVVSDTQMERHAVVYRYEHADSSTRTVAVWIVSGQPPSIGSKKPADGSPALVWPEPVDTLKLKWSSSEAKLLAEVDANVSISDRIQDCYFQYDRKTALVCIDTKQAEVRTRAG